MHSIMLTSCHTIVGQYVFSLSLSLTFTALHGLSLFAHLTKLDPPLVVNVGTLLPWRCVLSSRSVCQLSNEREREYASRWWCGPGVQGLVDTAQTVDSLTELLRGDNWCDKMESLASVVPHTHTHNHTLTHTHTHIPTHTRSWAAFLCLLMH